MKTQRIIKFRFYNKTFKTMHYFTLGEALEDSRHAEFANNMMQFTGLLDKNGVEIYFGDIVKYTDSEHREVIGEVVFQEEWARICIQNYSLTVGVRSKCEVIGNVFESEHLLKEENQDNSEAVGATYGNLEAKKEEV